MPKLNFNYSNYFESFVIKGHIITKDIEQY